MTDLGVKRKDMYGTVCDPCCDSTQTKADRDNEICYPKIEAYDALAKLLPVDQMKPGAVYETTVRIRLNAIDGYGKKDGPTRVSVDVLGMGDLEEEESDHADASVSAVMKVMGRRSSKS